MKIQKFWSFELKASYTTNKLTNQFIRQHYMFMLIK
jgi:hypothetical protein